MQVSDDTQGGMTFNGTGNICKRRRREPLGRSGGMLPQKIFNPESLEILFPALSGR